jgi:hypothetical protein
MEVPGGIGRWIPVAAVALAAVPLGLVVARRLASRARQRGVPPARARRRALAEVGLVGGTLPWLWMAFTPLPAARHLRLVPLRDLAEVLLDEPLRAFFQITGNLLVFAAFGFCAAARWQLRPLTVTALAAAGAVAIEAGQYAFALGRVSSVDDVLLNAAGAGIAALASRRFWPPPAPARATTGAAHDNG